MSHDPAVCLRSYCPECDAYGDGYIAGKTKAFSEVSATVLHGGHAPDCDCQPCRVVAAVVMAVLHERMEVLDAALRDLEDAVSAVPQGGGAHDDPTRELAAFGAAVVRWLKLDPEHAAFETLLADVNTLDTL